jgi:hypothetical protein
VVAVVEELHGSGYTDITLTTDGATAIGQWLVAIQGCDYYNASDLVSPTPGTWTLRAGDGNPSFGHPHVKVWTRPVTVAGANAVTFDQALDSGNHAHLRVLSAVDSFDIGTGSFGSSSVSHVCPSLTTVADGDLLINASIGLTNGSSAFDYSSPSGMVETDVATWSTMGSHTETLGAAGSTGTRTHTASAACEFASASIAIKTAAGGAVALEGIATAAATAGGSLTATRALAGSANAAGHASGTIAASRALAGVASAAATAQGALATSRPLAGSASAAAVLVGSLTVTRPRAMATGWGSLVGIGEVIKAEALEAARATYVDCPVCGSPIDVAFGWMNCPMGHWRVPAGQPVGW